MEKGVFNPFAKDWEIGSLGFCKGVENALLHTFQNALATRWIGRMGKGGVGSAS